MEATDLCSCIQNELSAFVKTRDLHRLERELAFLCEHFSGATLHLDPLTEVAANLLYEAHLFLGDYDSAWAQARDIRLFGSDEIFCLRSLCTTKTLDAFSLLRLAQGRDYYLCRSPADIALVETCADAELEALDRRLGRPFIEYLFQFGRRNLQLSDLRSLAATCGDETGDRYRMLLTEYSEYDLPGLLVPKKRGLFGSVLPVSEWQSIKWPKLLVCMHSVAVWLLDPIVRDCENAYRRLKGVPEIGQGWTSESLLFSLISDRFPREELVFHGTPPWLGLQHLDIYFPRRHLALEYQGEQHDKPIGRFGGEQGLAKRRELDARKKRLCEEHGCLIVYVHPGYKIDELCADIEALIRER